MAKYNIHHSFMIGLREWGTEFKVWYRTSTVCDCNSSSDPFYGSQMNASCSTCDGSGLNWSSTAKHAKGILNQFSKGLKYVKDGQFQHQIMPEGMARGTFWNDHLLINQHSPTGETYLTNCHTVEAMGHKYKVQNISTVGLHPDELSLVVVLNKIED